jgi:nitroreductase
LPQHNKEANMTDIVDIIMTRRSVRQYQDRPLEEATIRRLLEAAMSAPTACNSQPWEFVVVTEPETLEKLRGKLQFARYNAPCAIAVCGNVDIGHNSAAKRFWEQDCSAAMENILVAAAGLQLGAVWIGVHPMPSVIKPVQEILNIPAAVIPLGLAYVGYPAEGAVPPPRTQYEEHRVHWQIYEPRKPRAKKKNAKFE